MPRRSKRKCLKRRSCTPRLVALALCGISSFFAQDAIAPFRRPATDGSAPPAIAGPKDNGIRWNASYTADVFGSFTGGISRGAVFEELFKAGIALELEKIAHWNGASVALNLLYPHGSSLTSEHVRDFNTLSNIDAYDSVRLYDGWFQQELLDGRISIRLGQILADAEFFVSNYGGLFMNSSFGAIPLVSKNLNPPIFPIAAPGVRLRVAPTSACYVEAAVFSGDVGDPALTNKHNLRFSFSGDDGALVFAEVGYKAAPANLPGSYKLSGYFDSKQFAENRGRASRRGDYAVYFIADQELWRAKGRDARALSCFTRVGVAPADRNTVSAYADAGFNLQGLIPTRAEDIFGIAFSYTRLSEDLRDASTRAPLQSHHEGVLELTYQAIFGDHLSLQPDLQVIFNPGATKPAATAVVGGLRLNFQY